ncbi:hypothetical protein [Methylobacterium aerolatum]|uniref:Uncharacterized protein n=1 Tax=Methylobacterium aerolatum TaxID=418708 RepID=A0ABU0I4N6_9HYPH|nr:hypothetical protein [Methylobacterium aerolatum]MDQ0448646.1 hypothetical protein [Methylobacterium aerolatum]
MPTVIAATLVTLAGGIALWTRPWRSDPAPASPPAASGPRDPARSQGPDTTLYCEFNNFADVTPLVGFLFRIAGTGPSRSFALIVQREKDGSQRDFGGAGQPAPLWTLDTADTPPAIRAPEDDLRINLYGYDPETSGHAWFEAGLRSIRYRNLGGRCRQGA